MKIVKATKKDEEEVFGVIKEAVVYGERLVWKKMAKCLRED